MSFSVSLAWERAGDKVILEQFEIEYLLRAEGENKLLKEQVELLKSKIDLQNRELALKDMELGLEKKRADFEHEQFVRERETREFESKQYQELLKASKKASWIEKVGLGAIILFIGVIVGGVL